MGFRRKQHRVILCGNREVRYELVRRKRVRRNVYLDLSEDGGLRVIAPERASERRIQRELQARSADVLEFLARALEKKRSLPAYTYREGERHLFLGRAYPLAFRRAGNTATFDGECIVLRVSAPGPDTVLSVLRKWYRDRAAEHFRGRLEHFCERANWTGGRVAPLTIRRMKRTMGNCSRSGEIKLNPHLVKAPPELVDYVVAHEVCHLAEHNHGAGFYRLLDDLYPDWASAQARLKENWPVYLAE